MTMRFAVGFKLKEKSEHIVVDPEDALMVEHLSGMTKGVPAGPAVNARSSQPRAAGSPASAAPAVIGELYSPPYSDAAIEKALLY